MRRTITTKAPFDLRNQNKYFGGWPVLADSENEFTIVMTFPVEGWQTSAAVLLGQTNDSKVVVDVYGAGKYEDRAIAQALATISLDIDDAAWPSVGEHDKVIGALQAKYKYLRPVLFHSPYEAAAGFVIGQRISIKQRQNIQRKLAEQYGEKIVVEGTSYFAFPSPQALLEIDSVQGLNDAKIERLHGIAQAAINGKLDRTHLLSLEAEQALAELESLKGIGPFYASGILYRGAGIVDDITDDKLTRYAIAQAYQTGHEIRQEEAITIAENWKPYRMWCEVLLHVWLRREVGLPKK